MTSIAPSVGLVTLYNELQAAADVGRLAFDSRGAPTSDARTGADLFAKANMAPLGLHTGASLNELVGYLRRELDSGALRLENFDIAMTVEPYHLRERFGVLLNAFKQRLQSDMRGVNLRADMTPESIAAVRRQVAMHRIDGETFQVAASNAYLDMLRLRKFAEADKLAAAFPAGPDVGAAVFDVSRIHKAVLFEAHEDARFNAIECLGNTSGRAAALSDLEALVARHWTTRFEITGAIKKHVIQEAREGAVDPAFEPYMDAELRAAWRERREHHARSELESFARGNISGVSGYSKSDKEVSEGLAGECARLNAFMNEGLISAADIKDAVRTGLLESLANHGKLAPQTRLWLELPDAGDVPPTLRIKALQHYAAQLVEREPSAEWVQQVAAHAAYFPDGTQAMILGAVYRAKHAQHVDQSLLDAVAQHFPQLAATASAVRPPVFVKGIDVRARLRAELTSPEARALATVFCDWHGPGLGRHVSEHDPLNPSWKIGAMREACVALLPLPEVAPPAGAGLLAAIDEAMIKEGSTTRKDVSDRERRSHDHKVKLGQRIRDALGGKLTAVPYVGLLELQGALIRLNEELKGAAAIAKASTDSYKELWAEAELFEATIARQRDAKPADVRRTFDGVRYVIEGVGRTVDIQLPPGLSLTSYGPHTLRLEDKIGGRFYTDVRTQAARENSSTAAVFITVELEGGKPKFVASQVKPPVSSRHFYSDDSLQTLIDRVFEHMVLPGDFARRSTQLKLDDGTTVLANGPSRTGELELVGTNDSRRFFYDPQTKQVRFPEGGNSNWIKPTIVSGSVGEGRLVVSSFAGSYATQPGDPRETTKLTLMPGNTLDQAYVTSTVA